MREKKLHRVNRHGKWDQVSDFETSGMTPDECAKAETRGGLSLLDRGFWFACCLQTLCGKHAVAMSNVEIAQVFGWAAMVKPTCLLPHPAKLAGQAAVFFEWARYQAPNRKPDWVEFIDVSL